jgi:multiple sugar transport system permease protein
MIKAKKAAPVQAKYRRRGIKSLRFYLFASPWLLGFLALTVFPLGYALMISFTNFDGINENFHWVGLRNYAEVFHDALAWSGVLRTFLYALITVPLGIACGLGLALLLNRRMRAVGLLRTIFYLPSVVPIVATAIMFQLLFDRDIGGVNAVLEFLHGPTIAWLIDPTAFLVLIMMVLWGLGGGMIISLAGLQGVPSELLEAATVDGANPWTRFWRITLPMISPVLFFELVTNTIYALQTLVQPLLLSPSGGAGANVVSVPTGNQLYMIHVFTEFFYYQRFGYGSALLWVLFALILLITLLIFRSSAIWVYYEIDQTGGK